METSKSQCNFLKTAHKLRIYMIYNVINRAFSNLLSRGAQKQKYIFLYCAEEYIL